MNILCIFADQMHKYAMGCMGNPDILTPNLDALAADGVLFKRAYSNNPVCSPFRVHLMTGLYSSDTDSLKNCCTIPDSCVTLPTQCRDAGVVSSYVGKWHVGGRGNGPIPENLKAGFDHFIGYQCYNGFLDDVCFYDEAGNERRYDRHRTDVTADIAIERLEKIKDRQFIQYVCFQAPHYPEEPGKQYYDLYKDKIISKTPNYVAGIEPYTPTFSPPSPKPRENDRNYRRYGGDMDEYLRCYYGMVSQIDDNVGRLIDYLKQNDLYENTAVFFFADHGDMQGSHGKVNKCFPWEESAGIPFIGRVPGGVSGHVSSEYVSGVDTYPTFLKLLSVNDSQRTRGRDFSALLGRASSAPMEVGGARLTGAAERTAFSEGPQDDWVMLCRGDYKLVADRNLRKATMLFNLADDPYELCNLVNETSLQDRIETLSSELFSLIDDWSYAAVNIPGS